MKRIYLLKLIVLVALSLGRVLSASAQTPVPFTYNGSMQTYTVPAGCSGIHVDLAGAGGGIYPTYGPQGKGGVVGADVAVSAGQVLYIFIGQKGPDGGTGSVPPGGGSSGGGEDGGSGSSSIGGAAGGGGTDIRTSIAGGATSNGSLNTRIVVGGAGAGGAWNSGEVGGNGGYPNGSTGFSSGTSAWSPSNGATQTAGGIGEGGGSPGGFGFGGNAINNYYGSGGGGGWYGGGGCYYGSGGGGSSTARDVGANTVSNAVYTNATWTTNGYVTITPLLPTVTPAPTTIAFGSVLVGTTSVPMFTSLTGKYMGTGPLTLSVAAGSGFAISADGASWGNTATLAYTGTTFSGLNIYVRYSPTSVSSSTATLSITGGGLSTAVNVLLTGTGVNACTGTPSASTTTATPSSGGAYTPFTLSLTPPATTGGFTYQWQSAPSSAGPWTDISGAVFATYSFIGISASKWFRNNVTCTGSASTTASTPTQITVAPLTTPGCTPTTQTPAAFCCNFSIGNTGYPFAISGPGTLSDAYLNANPTRYTDFTSTISTTQYAGTTATYAIGSATLGGNCSVEIWADFNNNGTFETTEILGGGAVPQNAVATGTLTFPAGITPGAYRMRVVMVYTSNPIYPNISPCPPTSYSNFDSRDYTLVIIPPNCSGTPAPGIAAASATSACAPPYTFTPTLINVGANTGTGITYSWQIASAVGGPWANVGGATNTSYTASLTALGTVYYRMAATCAYGSTGYTVPVALSLNPVPSPVSGLANLCTGVTTTLISTPGGGTWSSSNTGVATTDGSTSGLITPVAVGNANIVYTLPTGCNAVFPVTVNTQPAAIVGPSSVCQNSLTTFTDPTLGGVWSSSTPTVGNITSSTGVLTANLAGSTLITYQALTGCLATTSVTVNALPPLYIVGGGGSYCVGGSSTSSVTLSSSTPGVVYQLLLNGASTGLPSLSGTSGALNFGVQSAPGTYTVAATNTATGCSRTMIGSAAINVRPLPLQYNVTGGGSYCASDPSTAPHVFMSGSEFGTNYQLMNAGAIVLTLTGSGGPIDFGPQPAAGCYTVMAVNTFGCSIPMIGSSCVTTNPPPTAFNVVPGTVSYCIGGAGIPVGLDFSNTGISYQLFRDGVAVTTAPVKLGTGAAISFGSQTVAGTYTIKATNVTTGCTAYMAGAASITISPLPVQHTLTTVGGANNGHYCVGEAGVELVLDASDGGVNYQLYNGAIPVGATVGGTGFSISFGFVTAPGTYTVVATDGSTTCSNNMAGTVAITVNPLPNVGTVTGGGNFCTGGTGVHVGLNPSQLGISYQLLKDGVATGAPKAGTGGAIDFGVYNTTGVYTVMATNTATGCQRAMGGAATIAVNTLPYAFTLTGAGSYCAGTGGTAIGLDGSATGITYQLKRGSTPVGTPLAGTGSAISFGYQTIAGAYTVVATNVSTTCTGNMSGTGIVTVNALPNPHLVTGGGNFCEGTTAPSVGVNGSEAGVSYQLFYGASPVGGLMPGTGTLLDFGPQALGGTYIIIATNDLTGCTRNMTGGAPVNVLPLPATYLVTGGGLYCDGTPGVHVGVAGSALGIKYQLYINGLAAGIPAAGTGSAVDFGLQNAAGTYTVVAKNNTTGCTSNMLTGVTVASTPLPVIATVTGGGNYCIGGTGRTIDLDASEAGVTYQLYRGTVMVDSVTGTGVAITFGPQTAAGNYIVKATNTTTTCTSQMTGTAVIGINPLPVSFTVTGGGNYCSGGTGFHIYLAGSSAGVRYQLMNGTTMAGTVMTGTGSGVDFGTQTDGGTYTVTAVDPATTCTNNMTGSAAINIYPLPVQHTVTGGGGYCSGGTGVNVGLDASDFGTVYQLFQGGVATGAPVAGTGSNINFGLRTGAADYTVVATTAATSCVNNMLGNATIAILPLPTAYGVTGGGTYCETGLGLHVFLASSDAGTSYQLFNGTTPVGATMTGTGGTLDFGLETLEGSYTARATNLTTACASNMSGTATISTLPVLLPHANISSSITGLVCTGQTVHYTAAPVNGGTAPTFQWFVNGTSVALGTDYSYMPLNGDVVTARITSNYQCAIPDTGSGTVVVAVSAPQMPSVSVDVNPGTQVCTGSSATFTASTMFAGTAPTLRWIKNGVFVGSGATYTYVPNNGDIVTFMLGSTFLAVLLIPCSAITLHFL